MSSKSSKEPEGASVWRSRLWPGEQVHAASWHGEECGAGPAAPMKQSWHSRARQRCWLPALEVGVWPPSQHCLPSPGPLSSVDQTQGPNRPIVILPRASMGLFRGFGTDPSGGHFLLPLQGALGHSLCLCGWGVWLW